MRYYKYLLVVFVLIFFSCEKNEINIITNDSIDEKDLKIKLNALIDDKSIKEFTIFENGKSSNIPSAYGENDWTVYFKDSLILSFRHFKTNRNNSHKYVFELEKMNNQIICNVSISGTDELFLKKNNK
jgi:hypothetical protein